MNLSLFFIFLFFYICCDFITCTFISKLLFIKLNSNKLHECVIQTMTVGFIHIHVHCTSCTVFIMPSLLKNTWNSEVWQALRNFCLSSTDHEHTEPPSWTIINIEFHVDIRQYIFVTVQLFRFRFGALVPTSPIYNVCGNQFRYGALSMPWIQRSLTQRV